MKTKEALNLKQTTEIVKFCAELDIDHIEVVDAIKDLMDDFEVDNFRFIETGSIDKIQQDELTSDFYCLGCFNTSFIVEHTDLSLEVVNALKKGEVFEALGELMEPHIEDIQSEYARLDGYGHHFAHYDHNEHELIVGDVHYHVFRTN